MMSRIAAPDRISRHPMSDVPPGHRFSLYLPLWNKDWGIDKGVEREALDKCCALGDAAPLLIALRARQQAQAAALPAELCLVIDALATAPFATGLGSEHPVENGFAFLTPYGLPYLAGSGVKGVLRRAMEELEEEKVEGIDFALIDALFGPEDGDADGSRPPLPDSLRRRGALSFWDVYPKPPGTPGRLCVEIMTPHQGEYYQGKQSPHDAGQPVPIYFLALPPQSKMRFIVTHEPALMPAELRATDWRQALDAAFARAFEWLGFGAKTAVGYGAMAEDAAVRQARERQEAVQRGRAATIAEEQRRLGMSPEQREAEDAGKSIDDFRVMLEAERKRNVYKPGSAFDQHRNDFLERARSWTAPALRTEAAKLLRESYKFTNWPGRKERKQEVKQWLTQLDGQT